jgi:methylated-DNA-protein-cysteine methyltransferase related protein
MTTSPADAAAAAAAAILAVVARIPRGRITTYGAVAERAGQPRRARLVGRVLSRLSGKSRLPWHRVVAAGGRIAFPEGSPARDLQVARLRREGVGVTNGRADLRVHGWHAPTDTLDRWLWQVGEGDDEN